MIIIQNVIFELTETIRSKGKKGSLLWLLDETKTAMGGRLLKQWIDRPFINPSAITARHDLVETLIRLISNDRK